MTRRFKWIDDISQIITVKGSYTFINQKGQNGNDMINIKNKDKRQNLMIRLSEYSGGFLLKHEYIRYKVHYYLHDSCR